MEHAAILAGVAARAPAQVKARLAARAVVRVQVRTLVKDLEMREVGRALRGMYRVAIEATANQEIN